MRITSSFFINILIVLVFSLKAFASKPPIWGFFMHKIINKQAVLSLPESMIGFYKKNIRYIESQAINPDQRRYAVANEAPKHYIDLDAYPDSIRFKLKQYSYPKILEKIGEDSLLKHGIVPWTVQNMVYQLTEAFLRKDSKSIVRISTDMGHYVADAHVPLHTTKNYNGQLSNQLGIHAFWESQIPENYIEDYDFWVGTAKPIDHVSSAVWNAVYGAHAQLDSVLKFEEKLSVELGEDKKFSILERNNITTKQYSKTFMKKYNQMLGNQINRQAKASVLLLSSLWYTAYINAGQPDLNNLKVEISAEEETEEKKKWLKNVINARKESDY
jgi:hypothetical protein